MPRKAVRVFCEDWNCPAKWSCAHFYGRQDEYWSMAEAETPQAQRTYRLEMKKREPNEEACQEYNFDERHVPQVLNWTKPNADPAGK